jgi:sulfur-oxidizing protein SoxY
MAGCTASGPPHATCFGFDPAMIASHRPLWVDATNATFHRATVPLRGVLKQADEAAMINQRLSTRLRRYFPVHNPPLRISVVSRRDVLLNARSAGLFLVLTPTILLPRAIAEDAAPQLPVKPLAIGATSQATAEETIRHLSRGAKFVDGKISINLPEIAENGNIVPFAVSVDSPMTDADSVKSIHVVCSGNPQPLIGSFHFTTLSGAASVTTRMRLAKSQDLFVLVERSNGQFILAQRTVKVTIGGCGNA